MRSQPFPSVSSRTPSTTRAFASFLRVQPASDLPSNSGISADLAVCCAQRQTHTASQTVLRNRIRMKPMSPAPSWQPRAINTYRVPPSGRGDGPRCQAIRRGAFAQADMRIIRCERTALVRGRRFLNPFGGVRDEGTLFARTVRPTIESNLARVLVRSASRGGLKSGAVATRERANPKPVALVQQPGDACVPAGVRGSRSC